MDLQLKLSQQEKIGVGKISKYTKSLTEFLSSLAEKAKDADAFFLTYINLTNLAVAFMLLALSIR